MSIDAPEILTVPHMASTYLQHLYRRPLGVFWNNLLHLMVPRPRLMHAAPAPTGLLGLMHAAPAPAGPPDRHT